jgi:S1-C subfamily serine protease
MAIRATCPACGRLLVFRDGEEERASQCYLCQAPITIPQANKSPPVRRFLRVSNYWESIQLFGEQSAPGRVKEGDSQTSGETQPASPEQFFEGQEVHLSPGVPLLWALAGSAGLLVLAILIGIVLSRNGKPERQARDLNQSPDGHAHFGRENWPQHPREEDILIVPEPGPDPAGPTHQDSSQGGREIPAVSLSGPALFKRVSPSIVQVFVKVAASQEFEFSGSGFVCSEDGLIATNHHVIEGAHDAFVMFDMGADGNRVKRRVERVAAFNPDWDVALLKINLGNLPALTLATGIPPIGCKVYAIGSPVGLTNSVSEGLVSGVRTANPLQIKTTMIQTTASISPGSSGGPLLSDDGKVVGILTIGSRSKELQNLNFAVPAGKIAQLLTTTHPPFNDDVAHGE